MTDHVSHSVGGLRGHLARRAAHVGMLVLPWLWYWHADDLAQAWGWSREALALALLAASVVGEALRLATGTVVFGQRAYEARQISALGWGAVSVLLVFLLAPRHGLAGAAVGLPIVASLSLVDPLMGELRRARKSPAVVAVAGLLGCATVWAVCAGTLGTPWLLVPLMAPLTVAAEWPSLRWIDDNATMTLVPLAAVLALEPWLSW